MTKWILFAILSAAMLVGCDDGFMQADKIVQDVSDIASGAQAILESPAGLMIPPEWKLYGALGVALANGLVITWQGWRNRQMKNTAKAIVQGIERTSDLDKATSEVKSNIAEEMRKLGGDKFYAKANKIVDRLKIS